MAVDFKGIALKFEISEDDVKARYLTMFAAIWKSDYRRFCRDCVRIRTKAGDLEPLVLNEAQEILLTAAEKQLKTDRWVRLAGLKGRRQGFSTMVAARGYWRSTLWDRQTYTFCHTK